VSAAAPAWQQHDAAMQAPARHIVVGGVGSGEREFIQRVE
jgi:hypothetical protein